ncbi:MAG: MCE family protein [Bdellovibrionales bacterium]|nr:MCE family protein [Bdellovibrionales bacterium]
MSSQIKVALLFIFSIAAIFVFVVLLGQFSLLGNYKNLTVAYNFAGGLEEGSHVRLMGVKVGKVTKVEFRPDYKTPQGEEVKLHIHIKIQEKAWSSLRSDSRYYINMAGIIGEKYLEITPGSSTASLLKEGEMVRGEDPPRIDQLISQGYALAGKILAMVEDNEESVVSTIGSINDLVKNLNKVLTTIDKITGNREFNGLAKQLNVLGGEMTVLLRDANAGSIRQMLVSMQKLLKKLEKIEEKEIRAFLQEEGIKARVAL